MTQFHSSGICCDSPDLAVLDTPRLRTWHSGRQPETFHRVPMGAQLINIGWSVSIWLPPASCEVPVPRALQHFRLAAATDSGDPAGMHRA